MKRIATIVLILASLAGTLAAQKTQTREGREQRFRDEIAKAKWLLVTKDDDGEPYHIDSLSMSRVMSTVVFATKSTKRGTIEYNKGHWRLYQRPVRRLHSDGIEPRRERTSRC